MEIWSNTDFPYQCLLDSNRTRAFKPPFEPSSGKILPVEETRFTKGRIIQAGVSYQMSGGLASLQVKLSEE